MPKTTVAILSLALALSLPASRVSAQLPANGSRRVLVLYSYARQLPWESMVISGLDEALNAIPLTERPFLFEESLVAPASASRANPTPGGGTWRPSTAARALTR